LFHLCAGTLRFSELHRLIERVTPRVLTRQLRELEEDGLIERIVHAQVPPRVDYRLSHLGRSMEPVLLALKAWGDAHIGLYGKPRGPAPRGAGPPALYTGGLRSPAGDAS